VAFYLDTPHDRVDEMRSSIRDGEVIAAMVVPLSLAEANDRLERFGTDRMYEDDCEGHVYTCRNFDESTRLCKIYEDRPEMCRAYPASCAGGCEFSCGYAADSSVERRSAHSGSAHSFASSTIVAADSAMS
jgi:Fe-S-cluster containining protein